MSCYLVQGKLSKGDNYLLYPYSHISAAAVGAAAGQRFFSGPAFIRILVSVVTMVDLLPDIKEKIVHGIRFTNKK